MMDKVLIFLSLVANCSLLIFIIMSAIRHQGRAKAWGEMRAELRYANRQLEIANADAKLERDKNYRCNAKANELSVKVDELQDQINRINTITIEDEDEDEDDGE